MKIGQLASFIDTEFLPDGVPRALPGQARHAARLRAARCRGRRSGKVLDEEWDEPVEELFDDFEHEASAAASIGQVHRAVLPDGRRVAVKVQYPGVAAAIARRPLRTRGMILRLAKAIAPGLDAKAVAEELKERVLEELDYELRGAEPARLRARLPRPPVHLRAGRGHAPVDASACW